MTTTPIHLGHAGTRYQTTGHECGGSRTRPAYDCPCPLCSGPRSVTVWQVLNGWRAICWHCGAAMIAEVGEVKP